METLGEKPVYFQRRYCRSDRVAHGLGLACDTDEVPRDGGVPLRNFELVFEMDAGLEA